MKSLLLLAAASVPLAALALGACQGRQAEQEAQPDDASRTTANAAAAAAPPSGERLGGRRPDPHEAAPARPPSEAVSPCLVQDGERLDVAPLRAVGTEPFWAARIEGRCVTYSHPEDQRGTRVWTRYSAGADGGTWSGALGGERFELRTRAEPGCSDGMSDNVYPIAVELIVGGERRRGCAEPASPPSAGSLRKPASAPPWPPASPSSDDSRRRSA